MTPFIPHSHSDPIHIPGDLENALAAETALRDRPVLLDEAVRDSERAFELAQIQHRVGTVELRSVEARRLALYSVRVERLKVQSD